MSSTIHDQDTAVLYGHSGPRIGHFYFDVTRDRLHCLNDPALEQRDAGLPLLAADPIPAMLRTESGAAVIATELPMPRALQTGRPAEVALRWTVPEQSDRALHYSATPLKDPDGKVAAVMVTVVCWPAAADWPALAGLAHDLRTPLQTVNMSLHVLEFRTLPETQRLDALVRLKSAADRALRIAGELLESCRSQGLRARGPQPTWFSLETCLYELLAEQGPAAMQKGLALEANLALIHGWQVYTDRERFARIVANLLVNAVRYTPAGGRVNLGGAWDEQGGARMLSVEVHDTGVGISPHEQESIFHPFERGQSGHDSDTHGTGVGLSVVDRLTHELGLTCTVCSATGQGSRFCVLVPQSLLRMAPQTEGAPRG